MKHEDVVFLTAAINAPFIFKSCSHLKGKSVIDFDSLNESKENIVARLGLMISDTGE